MSSNSRDDIATETFEIIEKKVDDVSTADSISSMSSSTSLLPSPSVSISNVPAVGNLLSNVQPPLALPSFIAQTPIVSPVQVSSSGGHSPIISEVPQKNPASISTGEASHVFENKSKMNIPSPTTDIFYPTQFSPAIPYSKGIRHGMESQTPQQTLAKGDTGAEGAGFMDWMRGAVGSGSILSKVAEKAKQSMDSMITTLDPQMREFLFTGGDCNILVASKQEVKISAIREAFQSVFGKAIVEGIEASSRNIAAQPVGFASGVKAAEERIQAVLTNPIVSSPLPVVAVENFLLEVGEDRWFDLGVLILNDPIKQITLQTFTQMTPVPKEIVVLAQEDTPADYPLRWSGLKIPIGSLMSSNLHVHHSEWHYALTGVARREIILQSARVLATLYKNSTTSA